MTPLVIRMMIVSDTTTQSITYDCQNDDHNIFKIQDTGDFAAPPLYHQI